MLSPKCEFCGHGNPANAKYCNECAAPLHLRPCNECDAVNNTAAATCYKCGAHLAVVDWILEGPVEATTQGSRVDFSTSIIAGFAQARQRLHVTGAPAVGTTQRRARKEAAQIVTDLVERFANERPFSVAPFFPSSKGLAQRDRGRVREASAGRYFVTRAVLPVILAASVAAASYAGYHYFTNVNAGSKAHPASGMNSSAIRTQPSDNALPPSRGIGTSAVLTDAKTPPAAGNDNAASAAAEGRIRTLTPETEKNEPTDGMAGESSSAKMPGDGKTTGNPSGSNTANTATTNAAANNSPQAKSRADEQHIRTPARRVTAAPPAKRAPASAFTDADALAVQAPVSHVREVPVANREPRRSCTDPIAALGLCNERPSDKENVE